MTDKSAITILANLCEINGLDGGCKGKNLLTETERWTDVKILSVMKKYY